jgi:hypothetical protein
MLTLSATCLSLQSPPWLLVPPDTDLSFTSFKKSATSDSFYKQEFLRISSDKYKDHVHIFTDGSKSEEKVAAAAVTSKHFKHVFSKRLPDNSSIYSVELSAILLALKLVYQSRSGKFLIVSDSLSSIHSLEANPSYFIRDSRPS